MIAKQDSAEFNTNARSSSLSPAIDRALAAIRSRILLAAFLRADWVSSLALDVCYLVAALMFPRVLGRFHWSHTSVFLLAVPVLIGLIRCYRVRVPHLVLARLIDEREGLHNRVATAYEIAGVSNLRAGISEIVSDDAEKQLARVDLTHVVSLKREALAAGLALALTIAICWWHSPNLAVWGLIGSGSGGSAAAGSQPVKVLNPEEAGKQSPSKSGAQHATPSAPIATKKIQPNKAQTPAAQKPQQGDDAKSSTSTGNSPSNNATSKGSDSASSDDKGANNTMSSNGAKQDNGEGQTGKQGSAENNHGSSGGGKSAAPNGSQQAANSTASSGKAGEKPNTSEQGKSGQEKSSQNSSGKSSGQQNGQGANQSGGQGKQNQGSNGQQDSGKSSGQQNGQSGSNQSGSQSGNNRSGNGSQGQGASQNGTNTGQSSQGNQSGGQGGSGTGDSGVGKAPSFDKNRSLPPVANRSTYSYKLPKPIVGGRTSSITTQGKGAPKPSVGRAATSQVPYGNGGASVTTSVQVHQVEQDPRIPAGYRSLVKNYFNGSSGGSSSGGQAH